ncbi:CPBP family intramembrane glutamic endopeptidase [Roseibacillus persicicus]|uniref:CPBP family intramembrane glutamic endopeptidase n=1 Tax=Roseibacillus persicicus TaxID=454148 RepID=UPI00398A5F51
MSEKNFEGFTPYDTPTSGLKPPSLPQDDDEGRPWGPWWSILWTVVVICVWQLAQVGMLAGMAFHHKGAKGLEGNGLSDFTSIVMADGDLLGLMSFGSALVGCFMILLIVRAKGVSFSRGLALRKPKRWWMWLLVFPAWLIGMILIGLIVSPFQSEKSVADQAQIAGMVEGTNWLIFLLLGVSVGAPFFEEFLFRGLLHEGLRQSFLGPIGSGILTAAFFSVLHAQYQDPAAFLMLFLLGGLFTLARELTGSLWIAIVMHAIQNTVVTGMMFLALNGYIPEDQMPEDLREIFNRPAAEEASIPAN